MRTATVPRVCEDRGRCDGPRRGTNLKDETHHHDDCDHHYLHVVSRDGRRSGSSAPAPPLTTWTRRFSPLAIRQPRCLTRLVLRDDRTRTSCPRRLTATKVAIDRYFSKKTPPRTTRVECGRHGDGGIRTTTTTTSYRLHATRRFTRCTGTGSSSNGSSGSTIRG